MLEACKLVIAAKLENTIVNNRRFRLISEVVSSSKRLCFLIAYALDVRGFSDVSALRLAVTGSSKPSHTKRK